VVVHHRTLPRIGVAACVRTEERNIRMIRVLLVDDHVMVRKGLRRLLESIAGVEVVAEAGNGREALALMPAITPSVVLLDIIMPGMNGLDIALKIRKDFPKVRVVMLTLHANEEYVRQALRAGAVGYLFKGDAPEELERALTTVMRGHTYLSPSLSHKVLRKTRRGGAEITNAFERLTPRQREVLQLITEGNSTRKIAQLLDLSSKTVETHRTALMKTLDIHDVAGLVRYAVRIGLIAPHK
jgi:DNA-binding NarL/FixJ family response regulator